jgi:hypothetical protein
MHRYLNLEASFKHVAIVAVALASFGSLFVTSAKAQATTWTVTIDVTSLNKKPVYFIAKSNGSCPYAPSHPESLHVCASDKVQWQAKTSGSANLIYIYQEDNILLDASGAALVPTLQATNGAPVGGIIDSAASKIGPHEYYIAVFDGANNRLYIDDPKIIIGTGTLDDVVLKMEKDCDKMPSDSDAKKLCREVQTLMNLLHLE